MTVSQRELAAVLAAFAEALKDMSSEEFGLLVRGEGRLSFVAREEPTKPGAKRGSGISSWALYDLAQRLGETTTRDAARQILAEALPDHRREDLVDLAKLFQVHVTKADSIERLEGKIVESVVGTKIRSEVFRRLPL